MDWPHLKGRPSESPVAYDGLTMFQPNVLAWNLGPMPPGDMEMDPEHISEKLYQCPYVNGRDIDNMFALYRKIQLATIGKDEKYSTTKTDGDISEWRATPNRDADLFNFEPSTPALKRFESINHSGRFKHHQNEMLCEDRSDLSPPLPPPPPPPDKDKPPYRRLMQFEPCGSPIDEMSGEETAAVHNVRAIVHAEDFDTFLNAYRFDSCGKQGKTQETNTRNDFNRPTKLQTNGVSDHHKVTSNIDLHECNRASSIDSHTLPWGHKYYDSIKSRSSQDGNWVLRERTPCLEATSINRSMITVSSPTKEFRSGSMRHAFSELHKGQQTIFGSLDGSLNRDRYLTHGRLKLYKSNSIGRHSGSDTGSDYSSWGRNSTMRLSQRGGSFSSRSSMDSFSNLPFRTSAKAGKPANRVHVSEVFTQLPQNEQKEHHRNSIAEEWPSPPDDILALSLPPADVDYKPQPSQPLSGHTDSPITPEIRISRAETISTSYTNSESGQNNNDQLSPLFDPMECSQGCRMCDDGTSISSMTSGSNSPSNSMQFRSCPDLIQPCLLQSTYPGPRRSKNEAYSSNNGAQQQPMSKSGNFIRKRPNHRHRSKKSKNPWDCKLLRDWEFTDIMLWLQHLDLAHVATLLVGYEITGRDLEGWNALTMTNLGINANAQQILLNELRALKKPLHRPSRRSSPVRSLFPLIQDNSKEPEESDCSQVRQILALTIDPMPKIKTQFSVAEGHSGGVLVTKVRGEFPLIKGDCIIELNGQSTLNMAAVDFTSALSTTDKNRLVLLRDTSVNPGKPPKTEWVTENDKSPKTEKDSFSADNSDAIISPSTVMSILSTSSSDATLGDDEPPRDDFNIMHF